MAWIVKTYVVVSPTPVVVDDATAGTSTSYQPGELFDASENNPSVNRLLEDQQIVESFGAPPTGFVIDNSNVTADLRAVLIVGRITGGNSIIMSDGDRLLGATDGGWSIGQIGDRRPANIYVGTQIVVGNSITIGAASVVGSGALGLASTGATADLTLTGRGTAIALNEATDLTLVTTSQTIIGSINELDAAIAAISIDLPSVLVAGNTTGPTSIIISSGQQIGGGRANFGSATAAIADGDLAAGDGTREITWVASTGRLSLTGITATSGEYVLTTGAVNGIIGQRATNTNTGTSALAQQSAICDTANATMRASSTGFTGGGGGANRAMLANNATTDGWSFIDSGNGNFANSAFRFFDNTVERFQIATATGSLLWASTVGDIGSTTDAEQPRDLHLNRSMNVGDVTAVTGEGSVRAGNSSFELDWDAVTGLLTVPNLTVNGTTTTIDTELQTADNFILLNSEYTGDAPQTAGLVLNIDPAATSFGISDITSNVITVASGDPSAVLSAADFLLVQNPGNAANAGVYEVLSSTSTTVTIDTTPVEAFSGDGLTDDATTQGTVVGLMVAGFRSDTTGVFQTATGTAAPLTWEDVASPDKLLIDYDTSGLLVGDCVRITGANTVGLTDADADSTADFIGVVETVGALGTGKVSTDGIETIRFAAGLTLAAGEPVFLAETGGVDGIATNVEPTTIGAVSYQIGYVKDPTGYTGTEGELAEVQLRFGGRVVIA